MRTITVDVFTFNELSDKAKDKAREWYRSTCFEYVFLDDAFNSLETFCNAFGVKIKDYSVGTWGHSYIKTDAGNANFRGLKLRDVKRDNMPTGYCLDCDLWMTFYDTFKATSDALGAFNAAIDAWVKAVVADMEYQESDECIDELMIANEYEFNENGEVY